MIAMTQHDTSAPSAVLPVSRTKAEAKRFYDRISRIYGWMTGAFERKHGEKALELLSITDGETTWKSAPDQDTALSGWPDRWETEAVAAASISPPAC